MGILFLLRIKGSFQANWKNGGCDFSLHIEPFTAHSLTVIKVFYYKGYLTLFFFFFKVAEVKRGVIEGFLL